MTNKPTPEQLAADKAWQWEVDNAFCGKDYTPVHEAFFKSGFHAGAARWVSVKERLPEYQDYYTVMVDSEYRRKRVEFFRKEDSVWVDCKPHLVTHWLDNVPEVPK